MFSKLFSGGIFLDIGYEYGNHCSKNSTSCSKQILLFSFTPIQNKDSNVRQVVVPIGIMYLVLWLLYNFSIKLREIITFSECMTWLLTYCEFTGLKVPAPTCKVILEISIPREEILLISSGVKCNPAVGAEQACGSSSMRRGRIAALPRRPYTYFGAQRKLYI